MKPNTPTEKGGYGTETGRRAQSVRYWPVCHCRLSKKPHRYTGPKHR